MKIITPTTDELRAKYDGDDGIHAIGDVPVAIVNRLTELKELGVEEAEMSRDWEGFAFAIVKGHEGLDCLAFTDTGRVGHGGVNLPLYFDTVAALLAFDQLRKFAHESGEAESKAQDAEELMRSQMRECAKLGVEKTLMARATGLSRQTVHTIVGGGEV